MTQRLGNWKAEDLQKFTYPVSEYILDGLLPDNHYTVWITLVRITELIYNTGRNGLTADDKEILRKLIARHNILTEEAEGLKSCVVTLHNLLHLPEDINRFGSPDNYWRYPFERAVKGYIHRPSNSKNLEYTYVRAESRKEFLRFTSVMHECSNFSNAINTATPFVSNACVIVLSMHPICIDYCLELWPSMLYKHANSFKYNCFTGLYKFVLSDCKYPNFIPCYAFFLLIYYNRFKYMQGYLNETLSCISKY